MAIGGNQPKFKDYRDIGAGVGAGRGVFKRLRKAGAFDADTTIAAAENPFTAEGAQNWQENPFARFTGAGRLKPNRKNIFPVVGDILTQNREDHQAALDRINGVYNDSGMTDVLGATKDAVLGALKNPVIPPEQLAAMQAAARERITREMGDRSAALGARLAGQGFRADDLNASTAAQTGNALYEQGQSDIAQETDALIKNREGVLAAIQSAASYGQDVSGVVSQLLAIEGFRSSLTEDELNLLNTWAGLDIASK